MARYDSLIRVNSHKYGENNMLRLIMKSIRNGPSDSRIVKKIWLILMLKTSFKKSEVSNRLILNIDFWFFILIFMIWNNQDLSDDWFFQSDKISVKSQNLALWFNQLSASDFLKDVFHTSYFLSRFFFLRIEIKEGLNMWPQKYFSPPRIKKTLRHFDQNA